MIKAHKRQWKSPIEKLRDDGLVIECLECTHCFTTTKEVYNMQEVFCPKCGQVNNRRIP